MQNKGEEWILAYITNTVPLRLTERTIFVCVCDQSLGVETLTTATLSFPKVWCSSAWGSSPGLAGSEVEGTLGNGTFSVPPISSRFLSSSSCSSSSSSASSSSWVRERGRWHTWGKFNTKSCPEGGTQTGDPARVTWQRNTSAHPVLIQCSSNRWTLCLNIDFGTVFSKVSEHWRDHIFSLFSQKEMYVHSDFKEWF